MRPISQDKHDNINDLILRHRPTREIVATTGVGRTTVRKIRKYRHPEIPPSKGGRPAKLTKQDKRYCVRKMTSGGVETAVGLAKVLENDLGINVSRHTVSRALKDAGMSSAE